MNILCLHGCCQNVEILKNLLRDYIKLSTPNTQWYFIEGKYNHSRCGKTWFYPELSLDQIGKDVIEMNEINNILNDIDIYIKENKINVLIGFSQGGNVVDCYLRLFKNDIKCAIIYAGYTFPQLVKLQNSINLPILYITSENDEIVPTELRPTDYENMILLLHDKGHKIPTQKIIIKQVLSFISDIYMR